MRRLRSRAIRFSHLDFRLSEVDYLLLLKPTFRETCCPASPTSRALAPRLQPVWNPLPGLQLRGGIERLEPLKRAGTTAGAVAPARRASGIRVFRKPTQLPPLVRGQGAAP